MYINRYEKEGRGRKTIKAQKLWYAILEAQTETGNPFMLYKDACNKKSNQQNLGTIRSSNLCTEIIEYSAPDEVEFATWLRWLFLHLLMLPAASTTLASFTRSCGFWFAT